jgi:hypothetical protein
LKGDIESQFSSTILEKAIKDVITSCGIPETALFNDGTKHSCKV